jgi:naphthoate synthase
MRWTAVDDPKFEDILYHHAEGIARITINRPDVHNAFRHSVRVATSVFAANMAAMPTNMGSIT